MAFRNGKGLIKVFSNLNHSVCGAWRSCSRCWSGHTGALHPCGTKRGECVLKTVRVFGKITQLKAEEAGIQFYIRRDLGMQLNQ